jgi:hypothetical protein
MNIYLILYILLLSVFLTITFSVLLKNKGPWGNPVFFFPVLFLTTWAITLWVKPVIRGDAGHSIVFITFVGILLALLVASSTTKETKKENAKLRKLKDSKVVEVTTQPEIKTNKSVPNIYYWVLLSLETIVIITGLYFIN